MITAHIFQKQIQSNSAEAFSLSSKSFFGEKSGDVVIYLPVEALYLMEQKKLEISDGKNNISFHKAVEKLKKIDKRLNLTYLAYKDMRKKGYILKTGLKFGGDFRVYKKGDHPGKAHSPWILVCEKESDKMKWIDFSAKSRVANSTRKKLLIALIDQENSPNYYEVSWTRL